MSKGNKNGVKKFVSRLFVEYRTTYKEIMDDDYFVVFMFDVFYLLCCYVDDFVVFVLMVVKVKLYCDLVLFMMFMVMENVNGFDVFVFSSVKELSEKEEVEDFVIVYMFGWYVVFLWVVWSDVEFYWIIKVMLVGDFLLVDIIE